MTEPIFVSWAHPAPEWVHVGVDTANGQDETVYLVSGVQGLVRTVRHLKNLDDYVPDEEAIAAFVQDRQPPR